MSKKDPNTYPKGWNRERVQRLIQHYDKQTEDEEAAEIEAAQDQEFTTMHVPRKLVPIVDQLIALMEKEAHEPA